MFLPSEGVFVEKYGFEAFLTAEDYYKLLPDEDENDDSGSFCEHSLPSDNEELPDEVQEAFVEEFLESFESAIGNSSSEISTLLKQYKKKATINWKQVLKRYLSKKSKTKTATRMRRNRRFPGRLDVPGYKKEYISSCAVLVDVSGSMSDDEINAGLEEINEICKVSKSDLKLVQVDTSAGEIQTYKRNMTFTREFAGGTRIYEGVKKLLEKKVKFDVLVIISDCYLFGDDFKNFSDLKKPQIWLNTGDRSVKEELSNVAREFMIDFKKEQ
jgi:predicted metal-dependent peptidase